MPDQPGVPSGSDGSPGPDEEFDRQLRALTGDAAGLAGFAEPSAAERARKAVRPAGRRRDILLARQLREPVLAPGQPRPAELRRRAAARRWSPARLAHSMGRSRPMLVVILVLAALVATAIGLSWLSNH